MAKKVQPLSDQLRAAVEASDLSRYRIAKEIGCSQALLSRFMSGGGLSFDVMDRLAELLQVNLARKER